MVADVNTTVQGGGVIAVSTIAMAVAAAATGLALAQTPAAAGNLVLAGSLIVAGAYTGTGARRIVVASDSAGDNTQTITITGTDRNSAPLSEVLTLAGAATITSVNDFLTVTKAAISAAAAGNITAGTSAKASGAWIPINFLITPTSIALGIQLVSGAANYTVEHTYDDPNGAMPGSIEAASNSPPVVWPDAVIVTKAATFEGTIAVPFFAYRLTLNSGTGKIQMQGIQAGLRQS